jgi:hypothetical protein
MNKPLKELEKYILKNYGKKCKSYNALCCVYIVWRAFETLENIMDDETYHQKNIK